MLVNKSSPAQSPSVLVKNCVSESHEGPQELQLDNESVSDELFILASQKYEDDRGCYLEENDETDEILLLASQQFEEQYSSDGEVSKAFSCMYSQITAASDWPRLFLHPRCFCLAYHYFLSYL